MEVVKTVKQEGKTFDGDVKPSDGAAPIARFFGQLILRQKEFFATLSELQYQVIEVLAAIRFPQPRCSGRSRRTRRSWTRAYGKCDHDRVLSPICFSHERRSKKGADEPINW